MDCSLLLKEDRGSGLTQSLQYPSGPVSLLHLVLQLQVKL